MGISARLLDYSRIPRLLAKARTAGQPDAVFIWIPKTAGSSLYRAISAEKLKTADQVRYRFGNRGIVTFGHMSYPELVRGSLVSRRFDEASYKFAFVRNPYDRAVSLYAYFAMWNRIDPSMTFLDFCNKLKEGCEPIGLDNTRGLSQANPQVRWLEGVELDFLGRVETIDRDLSVVLERLGLPRRYLSRLNTSERTHCADYYCEESKGIVQTLYREDFESLGYDTGVLPA